MAAPTVQQTADGRTIYVPDGAVLSEFLLDRSPVSIIQGPIGSGKSKACNLKVFAIASEQKRNAKGIRHTRWAVVRNTYPELQQTTIRTWLDTFPEDDFGRMRRSIPFSQIIRCGDVLMEIDFLALDKPEDVKKLRSGEYTGFYVNELPFIIKELMDEMTSRVGRFPPMKDGGPTWSGVIADANAPEEDHWLAMMTGQVELPNGMSDDELAALAWPEEWAFFMQPPGLVRERSGGHVTGYQLNPLAENTKWLPPRYYENMVRGKTRAWIDSRIMNVVTVVIEGNPVWPSFSQELHVAPEVLRPTARNKVYVGLDFGRQPAAIFGQHINNRVIIQYELVGQDEGAAVFAPKVKAFLEQHYPGFEVEFIGDPKGADKTQADEHTAYDIFRSHGMPVRAAPVPGNNIATRVGAVEYVLNGLTGGKPRFMVSPICRSLIMAMKGKYHTKKNDMAKLEPVKDKWSNIADALQYDVLGMGEGRAMIGLTATNTPKPTAGSRPVGSRRRVH